jgi:excinuclease ABC subunit C
MREVITRRFTRYINETSGEDGIKRAGFDKLPDMIFADGGKGQISAITGAVESLGLKVEVCGMVKDDRHRTRALMYKGRECPLDTRSEGFKLLTRMQDEVHRFAIEYHRQLRGKQQIKSILDDIKGIGAVRRKALLRHFGSIDAIMMAEVEELKSVDGMDSRSAEAVYSFFRDMNN